MGKRMQWGGGGARGVEGEEGGWSTTTRPDGALVITPPLAHSLQGRF